jgi:hypothetical protein
MKIPRRFLELFFIILGTLCLVVAQLAGASTVIGGALVNLGVAFISIVILDIIWSAIGGEPLQGAIGDLREEVSNISKLFRVLQDAEQTGVTRIVSKSDEYGTGSKWRSLLSESQKNVDLCGAGLHGWLKDGEHFVNIIKDGASRGCYYRLLLYAPLKSDSSPNHPLRQIIEIEKDRSISTASHNQEAIKFFLAVQQDLPAKMRKHFQVKVLDDKIMYSLISRFDNILVVTCYMYCQRSESSPLLEIRGPDALLFKSYIKEFDALWNEKARDIRLSEV